VQNITIMLIRLKILLCGKLPDYRLPGQTFTFFAASDNCHSVKMHCELLPCSICGVNAV